MINQKVKVILNNEVNLLKAKQLSKHKYKPKKYADAKRVAVACAIAIAYKAGSFAAVVASALIARTKTAFRMRKMNRCNCQNLMPFSILVKWI